MIIGMGADFVEVERIRRFAASSTPYGLGLVFSEYERERIGNAQFLAGRFAVKEALLKAARIGFTRGLMRLSEIETLSGESGAPEVRTHGRIAEVLEGLGATQVLVTITHDRGHALAVVLLAR